VPRAAPRHFRRGRRLWRIDRGDIVRLSLLLRPQPGLRAHGLDALLQRLTQQPALARLRDLAVAVS
jgi:hypothetical protein